MSAVIEQLRRDILVQEHIEAMESAITDERELSCLQAQMHRLHRAEMRADGVKFRTYGIAHPECTCGKCRILR